jgi:hypothetical protein
MKFFGGILCEDDGCYLSVVLRHVGAFSNKVVRNGKRRGLLLLWRGSLLPLGCEADLKPEQVVCQMKPAGWMTTATQPSGSKLPRHS